MITLINDARLAAGKRPVGECRRDLHGIGRVAHPIWYQGSLTPL